MLTVKEIFQSKYF